MELVHHCRFTLSTVALTVRKCTKNMETMALGPFEISAKQIADLDTRFTRFINLLLETEVAAERHPAHLLIVNENETTKDGGVDASIIDWPTGSDFIPSGTSAFQFKRSNFSKKECADEFRNATAAHKIISAGGTYVIAIAHPLSGSLIDERHAEVMKVAIELELLEETDGHRIRVYDANTIARWSSGFASLAVSDLVNGPGYGVLDYSNWAAGRPHQVQWVPNQARTDVLERIRADVVSLSSGDFRIQGDSGIGKTRLAMEIFRDPELSPLVLYTPDATQIPMAVYQHLRNGRPAILIVDECPPEFHIKVLEQLSAGSPVRVLTLGPMGSVPSSGPQFTLGEVESDLTKEFLKKNYSGLSPQARSFIVRHARGNLRWTMLLADAVLGAVEVQAAELIAKNDIEKFVTEFLPQGRDFFYSAVLALFERVGWEGDLGYQLKSLAEFANASIEEMKAAGELLEQNGLLVRQGRYRSVGPHPLAVFLAADAWQKNAARIVQDLLPVLDDDMAVSFFQRAADLGRFQPAQEVLPGLIAPGGPFDSLGSIEKGGRSKLLTSLAIVMPDALALHLWEILTGASADDLQALNSSRRSLVWTLEKLVWHSKSFEMAADGLLMLALNETEEYSNNATGTWVDLFGLILPGTAARTAQRLEYLQRHVRSSDETDALVIAAAKKGLDVQESIVVYGELQGGSLVEPRGGPATWDEVSDYRRGMVDLLFNLSSSANPDTARVAEDALISAVHSLVDDRLVGPHLIEVLTQLGEGPMVRLRTEIERLTRLYDRHSENEFRDDSEESVDRDAAIVAQLTALSAQLPAPTPQQAVAVLAQLNEWDTEDSSLTDQITSALSRLSSDTAEQLVAEYSKATDVPAAWQIGLAASRYLGHGDSLAARLAAEPQGNLSVVTGFLVGQVASGDQGAFDRFAGEAKTWPTSDVLQVLVRGPQTTTTQGRLMSGIRELRPSQSAYIALAWNRNLSDEDVSELLDDLLARVEDQLDYNSVVEFTSLVLHNRESLGADLGSKRVDIAKLRLSFPEVGQKRWNWCRLIEPATKEYPIEISQLVLELVTEKNMHLMSNDSEAALIRACAAVDPPQVWDLFTAPALEPDGWRLGMSLRKWFVTAFEAKVITSWIGTDLLRARLVAQLVDTDTSDPSDVVQFLLEGFDDDKLRGRLYGAFVSGFWSGNESDRIRRQLQYLHNWRTGNYSKPVRQWAKDTSLSLESRLQSALREEAEERF
jgi:hypothetical protein